MSIQNKKTALEVGDVRPVIDEKIVNIVNTIFRDVLELNPLADLFKDLAERLAEDLFVNSFMDENLELTEEQKKRLLQVVRSKGEDTANKYLANIDRDERAGEVYRICKEQAAGIADAVLSAIGKEINRGAIINARAVQANAKGEDWDEILLRKTKTSGDITIPTNCVLISTNCVEVIKSSCKEEPLHGLDEEETGEDEEETEDVDKSIAGQVEAAEGSILDKVQAAADKPVKTGRGKK